MALHVKTAAGMTLSLASMALSIAQHFLQPAFDLRLIAPIFAFAGYALTFFDIPKYSSVYQIYGMAAASLAIGMSVDHLEPFLPYMTIALLMSMAVYKKFLRKWFSETDAMWFDVLMTIGSFGVYLFANLTYPYGWQGWVFPLPFLLVHAMFTYSDTKGGYSAVSYFKGKTRNVEVGKNAPDFQLPDREGKQVTLGEFKDKQNVLLIFIRNDWCPSCRIMLRTYEKHREKFKNKNVHMFAISPGTNGHDNDIMNTVGIQFNTLYDEKQEVCARYGVQLPLGAESKSAPGMPLPASFLVDVSGVVRYTSRLDRIGEFLDPESIFPALDQLN